MLNEIVNVLIQIPNYIFWKDLNSVYMGANKELVKVAGLESVEEIIGKNDFDLVWGEQFGDLYRQGDQAVLDGEIQLNTLESLLQADGRLINIKISKKPLYDKNGQKIGVISSFTEMKQIEYHGKLEHSKRNIPLTKRQLDCLVYLAKGMTAKQIALELDVSRRTIESHIEVLKLKFNSCTKVALIQKAWSIEFVRTKILETS